MTEPDRLIAVIPKRTAPGDRDGVAVALEGNIAPGNDPLGRKLPLILILEFVTVALSSVSDALVFVTICRSPPLTSTKRLLRTPLPLLTTRLVAVSVPAPPVLKSRLPLPVIEKPLFVTARPAISNAPPLSASGAFVTLMTAPLPSRSKPPDTVVPPL
jgi:hypothetical protein